MRERYKQIINLFLKEASMNRRYDGWNTSLRNPKANYD